MNSALEPAWGGAAQLALYKIAQGAPSVEAAAACLPRAALQATVTPPVMQQAHRSLLCELTSYLLTLLALSRRILSVRVKPALKRRV